MFRFYPLFLLLLVALLVAPVPAPAQLQAPVPLVAPQITAALSARAFGPGQQVVLTYQIIGAQSGVEDYPRVIETPGLTLSFSGQVQRFALANGVRRSEISIRYMVESRDPGEFEIAPQSFRVDGMEMISPAVKVTVREGEAVDSEMTPSVQLTLGKTEFWKGEVIPVQVAILVHPAVQPLSQFFPQVKTPNFAVTRFDRSAGLEAREVNGEVWRAWQMESVMTALQAGAQQFGPAEIKAELMMPSAGGFSDPYGRQQGSRRTITLTSNHVPVNVKELPLEGKPENFSGAVGEFDISLEASPVTLNAGDPIAVEIAISGTGNFDAITAPVMETAEGWRLYAPRISQENRAWGTELGRKSFTQILIPEKPQTEIPPFVLHFFDPKSGTYMTRRTTPVALTVTGEFKAPADAAGGSKDFAAPVDATAPTEELGDILDQPLTGSPWMATAAAPAPVSPLLLHGVPALLLSLLVGHGLLRRWQAAAAARKPALGAPREPHQVLTDLRHGNQNYRTFYGFVDEYLTAAEYHHGRQPAAGEAMTTLLRARDRWLYGPADAASSQPVPAEERRRTLEVISKL